MRRWRVFMCRCLRVMAVVPVVGVQVHLCEWRLCHGMHKRHSRLAVAKHLTDRCHALQWHCKGQPTHQPKFEGFHAINGSRGAQALNAITPNTITGLAGRGAGR